MMTPAGFGTQKGLTGPMFSTLETDTPSTTRSLSLDDQIRAMADQMDAETTNASKGLTANSEMLTGELPCPHMMMSGRGACSAAREREVRAVRVAPVKRSSKP
jgi:hypothetical protein